MSHDGPSKMDITEQKAMYDAFWSAMIRVVIFILVVLFLMLVFLT
ncbi:MAG: aa3-type cytochrome c oxidase subunit IV [Pseudomonadota bacterium]